MRRWWVVTDQRRDTRNGTDAPCTGVANVCLLTQHTTIVRQRIDVPIPRKRKGGGTALGADKASLRSHTGASTLTATNSSLIVLTYRVVTGAG